MPAGYTHDGPGATKAGLNAIVAAKWMRLKLPEPWPALSTIAIPDGSLGFDRVKAALTQGKTTIDKSGKPKATGVIGARVLSVDGKLADDGASATVVVMWEAFNPSASGKGYDVEIQPSTAVLSWVDGDWKAAEIEDYAGTAAAPMVPVKVGTTPAGMPVPTEDWYW